MLFSFQCAGDTKRCTVTGHRSFRDDSGEERNVMTNADKLHDSDTLRTADLSTFAWQIAKGMVRDGLCLQCREIAILFEYRKTKTKGIALANHKGQRQSSEPIKPRRKPVHVTASKRWKTCVSVQRLVFVLLLIGRNFKSNHRAHSEAKPKQLRFTFDTQKLLYTVHFV